MLLAGCLHALSMAWPFAFLLPAGQAVWWLQPLSLLVLVALMDRATTAGQGAWLGWFFATALQCATWWWLFVSLHTYGGLATPLAVIAIVGLAGFLALYYATVCGCFMLLAPVNRAARAIVFGALWLLAELGRVALFTGFPWGEGGYAQLDGPFADLVKLVGVHGLTFAGAALAAGLAGLLLRPRLGVVATVAAGLLVGWAASSFLRLDKGGASAFTSALRPAASVPFTVTLLQGNIAQDQKFGSSSGVPDALYWYRQQMFAAKTSMVVTPETAIPLLPAQLPLGYLEELLNHFVKPEAGAVPVAALVGIPLGNREIGYTNSVIGLKPKTPDVSDENAAYRYDKHHLVPFGEFVHPLFKWFLDLVHMPLSDFNRGAVSQPSFEWQGQRIAPNICYEDLFGEELAARFVDPALAPTMFVNISNIGWFGNTIAIDQHLNISRMRAIEFERPMIRATNTGATVVIDHRGEVTDSLQRHTRGTLVATVEGRSGTTPYAWWTSRLGLWPWWVLCAVVIGLAFIRRRKRHESLYK